MLTASLLREAMWSMVSELYSTIEMDFVAYTKVNLRRFDAAWSTFEAMDRA
jgi:thiamine kinase-like enzyme